MKDEFYLVREEMEKVFIKEKDYFEIKLRDEYSEIIKIKDDFIWVFIEEKDFFLNEFCYFRKLFDFFIKYVY